MNFWEAFWTFWLITAGTSFAVITGIVTVKGYQDLRNMFSGLAAQRTKDNG
ncbi:MAG: hypothetical protein ACM3JB_12270 [Acidobacteriaceae bacterium]